jgi:murein DD-endopeptidase MepM/ murein hydrolase activator NlpD
VERGDVLGIMGNTGYSFGAHLHFEVRIGSQAINAAGYLGIPNETGAIVLAQYEEPDYAALVVQKCGLEQQTKDYLDAYKYAKDLWRKLYEQMV